MSQIEYIHDFREITKFSFRMIVAIAVSLVMPSVYHLALIYVSLAVMFFLVSSVLMVYSHSFT